MRKCLIDIDGFVDLNATSIVDHFTSPHQFLAHLLTKFFELNLNLCEEEIFAREIQQFIFNSLLIYFHVRHFSISIDENKSIQSDLESFLFLHFFDRFRKVGMKMKIMLFNIVW